MKLQLGFLLCLLAAILGACGSLNDPCEIDSELSRYVAQVNQWTGDTIKLPLAKIGFGEVSGEAIAVCRALRLGVKGKGDRGVFKQILVDRATWDSLSDNSRLLVISHELNHCLHGVKDHDASGLMGAYLDETLDARTTITEYANRRK
jgi:hypothetical protein